VTKKHAEDAMALLRLMGVPVIQAPSEAEATCAALAKAGLCYAAVTEDMDTLAFGTPLMLKNLFDTENARAGSKPSSGNAAAEKKPVYEISLEPALTQLGLTMDQFIDFCMLCGCDYLPHLPKVGATTAIKLVLGHVKEGGTGAIEALLEAKALPPAAQHLASSDEWPYAAARNLFKHAEVVVPPAEALQPTEPDYDALTELLVTHNSFAPQRVEAALKRLRACRQAKTQTRLDQFFTPTKPAGGAAGSSSNGGGGVAKFDPFAKKRKAPDAATPKGKGKAAGGAKRKAK
jgi:flap endonuclease-1